MKTGLMKYGAMAIVLVTAGLARADWQPVEEVRTYLVSGRTGAELYASIGERGPMLGGGRAIAHTTFRLTWTRKYEPRGNACVISVNRPKLVIVYTFPKAQDDALSPKVRASWLSFLEGIKTHEKVHGASILRMVRDIEAQSVGLSDPADPDCRKVRAELQRRLGSLSERQRQEGRDFDTAEMGQGGNVQQLILRLVNGP